MEETGEAKVHSSAGAVAPSSGGIVGEYLHFGASLGALYLANKGLASVTAAAGVKFPSALIGWSQSLWGPPSGLMIGLTSLSCAARWFRTPIP